MTKFSTFMATSLHKSLSPGEPKDESGAGTFFIDISMVPRGAGRCPAVARLGIRPDAFDVGYAARSGFREIHPST
jgi:hypothetical protein